MGGERDMEPGRPVEPGEARTHGSDPEAVRVNREGERDLGGGERHVGRT